MLSTFVLEGEGVAEVTTAFCCCCLIADARSTADVCCWSCCCCIIDEARSTADCCLIDARSIKLFENPAAVRFPTVAASKADWPALWIVAGDERTTLGGDVMAVWVRAAEIEVDWTGSEIVVVTTELGRWLNGWSLGFSLVGEGVLLRNETSCCFGGIGCWECSKLDVSPCTSGEIISAKSSIVTAGFDFRLSNTIGGLTEPFDVSFLTRFKSVITGTAWSFSSVLFTAVLSILVAMAEVTMGLCTVTLAWTNEVVGLLWVYWLDCARFFRADIAGVAVAPGSAGIAVVKQVLEILLTAEVLLGRSGWPVF